jgi:DNA-binding FadR family transcriptional regulator
MWVNIMERTLQPLERPPLLHRSVQEAIRAYVIDNNLQPGDPLPPEAELGRQLGVSRNSVREAVKALESLGVLEVRRGSGIFVRDFSFEPLLDVLNYGLLVDVGELAEFLQVRRVLESGMIEAAMQAMTETEITTLENIVAQMRVRAERGEAFVKEDREFHQRLFEKLGNRTFLKLLDIFWLAFRKASEHAAILDTEPMVTYQAHAAIVEAVKQGDVEGARQALDQHYAGLEQRLARHANG